MFNVELAQHSAATISHPFPRLENANMHLKGLPPKHTRASFQGANSDGDANWEAVILHGITSSPLNELTFPREVVEFLTTGTISWVLQTAWSADTPEHRATCAFRYRPARRKTKRLMQTLRLQHRILATARLFSFGPISERGRSPR